jgi:hypothetical protein
LPAFEVRAVEDRFEPICMILSENPVHE